MCKLLTFAYLFVALPAIGPMAHAGTPALQPAQWEFPDSSGCGAPLGRMNPEIQRWRDKAIVKIREGLAVRRVQQIVELNMEPFLPPNLDEVAATLQLGMVALMGHGQTPSNTYFEEGKAIPGSVPADVFQWASRANHFLTKLVIEALEPMLNRKIYPLPWAGRSKIGIGGESFTGTDDIPHVDGNCLINIAFNAAGDITTEYEDPSTGKWKSAAKHSVFLILGSDWEKVGLGKGIVHKVPSWRTGLRFVTFQFLSIDSFN